MNMGKEAQNSLVKRFVGSEPTSEPTNVGSKQSTIVICRFSEPTLRRRKEFSRF
jgi:hypothetical protein